MYLIHNTDLKSVIDILQTNELRSLSLIKKYNKDKSPNEGDGIYTKNNFIYFTCTDTLDNKHLIKSEVSLFFDPKLLYNRVFYINNGHTNCPNINGKKYDRYYSKYNSVIKKLYEKASTSKDFQVMMQIAIKNKVNLDHLVDIKVRNISSQKSE